MVNIKSLDAAQPIVDMKGRLSVLEKYGIYTTLNDLKNAEVGNLPYYLITSKGKVEYSYSAGNYTDKIDDDTFVSMTKVSPSLGALVRQSTDTLLYRSKFNNGISRTVTNKLDDTKFITDFGPEGTVGVGQDDTLAFEKAINSGYSINLAGKTIRLSRKVTITKPNIVISGGTIKILPWNYNADSGGGVDHFRAIFIDPAASYVVFDGVVFDARGIPGGTGIENGFIWSQAPFTSVTDCVFISNPKGTCVWGLSAWVKVQNCTAVDCSALVFARGRNPLISDNIIINALDAAIALNGLSCVGGVVTGNTIHNDLGSELPAVIAIEESASDWIISNNIILGASGGGIWCGNVLLNALVYGGIISDNLVSVYSGNANRPTTVNPATLLYISNYYANTKVSNNLFRGCPSGNSASRMVVIPATGTIFENNTLDGIDTSGIGALVSIMAGGGGVHIKHNSSTAAAGGRHYLFGGGNYNNNPCRFENVSMFGGAEGINSELSWSQINNLKLFISNIHADGVAAVTNCISAIGSRSTFLNTCWQFPHSIAEHTVMYGTEIPTNSGALPFLTGDKIYFADPSGINFEGAVKVTGGTPWRKFGALE